MKKILFLLGGAIYLMPLFAQTENLKPALYIGDRLPKIHFADVLCYKKNSVSLSEFQHQSSKLVIFDFWFTNCSSCIEQFPKLEKLQHKYKNKIQIVLVAHESKAIISKFIQNWEKLHQSKFKLPIITNDTILHKLIRHRYESHIAWITPDRVIIAQSSPFYLNADVLEAYLKHMPDEIKARGFLN